MSRPANCEPCCTCDGLTEGAKSVIEVPPRLKYSVIGHPEISLFSSEIAQVERRDSRVLAESVVDA